MIAAVILSSSMLTSKRVPVSAMRAKLTVRLEPSTAPKVSESSSLVEFNARSAIADSSGMSSMDLPTWLAVSGGVASTVPALSISTADMPGRPPRLLISFDIQSRLMLASSTASTSGLIAETG